MGFFDGASNSLPQLPTANTGPVQWNPRTAMSGGILGAATGFPGLNPLTGGFFGQAMGLPGASSGSGYYVNPGSMPDLPNFHSIAAGGSGQLNPQYEASRQGIISTTGLTGAQQFDPSGLQANTGDLNALRNYATSNGPSPWLSSQLGQLDIQKQNAQGNLANQAATQTAQAQDALAMRGGLRGGAGERIAKMAGRDQSSALAGLNNQDMQARLGLSSQDAQQKLGVLQQLPGQDLAFAQNNQGLQQFKVNTANDIAKTNAGLTQNAEGFNAGASNQMEMFNKGNLIGDVQGQNAFNNNIYGEKMKAFGAANTANALGNGGKK